MYVASWCSTRFVVILCVGFCTGHFVMVPLNLTLFRSLQFYINHVEVSCDKIYNFCTLTNVPKDSTSILMS